MRKVYSYLLPAFMAIVLCASCQGTVEEGAREAPKLAAAQDSPPKSKIKLPPGYERTPGSEAGSFVAD